MLSTSRSTYARISRTGIVPGTKESARMTRDNLVSLRAAGMREEPAKKAFSRVVSDIKDTVTGMFFLPPKKVNSMCKYYGHVIDRAAWTGILPKCMDCGSKISTPDQLRQSNTREVLKKGH